MADNVNISIQEQAIDLKIDAGVILSISNYPGVGGLLALQGSGTYTQAGGTIQFANSHDLIFGLQSNRMTASFSQSTHEHPYLGSGESTAYQTSVLSTKFLTTAIASQDTSLFQYVSGTSVITSAAFPSASTTKFAGSGFTTVATAGTAVVGTLSTNGLSLGVPAYLTTAALLAHSHGNPTLALTYLTGTTASASNGLTLSLSGPSHGNLYFVDSNGHTFSSSVSGVSTSIWINT